MTTLHYASFIYSDALPPKRVACVAKKLRREIRAAAKRGRMRKAYTLDQFHAHCAAMLSIKE